MKLAHITQFYFPPIGGQQLYIHAMLGLLDSSIIQTIYQGWPTNIPTGLRIKTPPLFVPYVESRISRVFPYYSWYRFNYMLRFQRKQLSQYDVLICHYPFHYPIVRWHPNVIVLSHGVLWRRPTRSFTDKFLGYWANKARSNCTIVANDTDFLREIGINIKPASKDFEEVEAKTYYFPNCIDISVYREDQTQQAACKDRKIILVPRNIRHNRGVHLAIEAFGKISSILPGYKLKIVGSATSGTRYLELCNSVVNQYNIQDKVLFAGPVEYDKMVNEYRQACMSIIPTIEFEGTSLSALESMAAGTPVISTNVGGLMDLPTLKCDCSPDDMASKILLLLRDYDYYKELQCQTVRNKFFIERLIENWNSLLFSLI